MLATLDKPFNFADFLATLKYPPNAFQLKVLESIASGSGNIVVSALAGSGKTSLLVMCASLLQAMGESSATFIAFNVKIRDELNQRLPPGYAAINSHRLGNQMLKSIKPSTRVDAQKWRRLAEDACIRARVDSEEMFSKTRTMEAMFSKAMLNNADMGDPEALLALAERYSLEGMTYALAIQVKKGIADGRRIFEETGAISFDEMLYLPVVLNLQPPKSRLVFIDEAQDLNVLQQILAARCVAEGGRKVTVGDENQSIYFFAGADAASFRKFMAEPNTVTLPLNVCYRCPESHLGLARNLVPAIEARPGAPAGDIHYAAEETLYKLAKPGALVMCRLTAPLISAYFQLIQNKVRAVMLGRDIAASLQSTLDKVAALDGFTYDRVIEFLQVYESIQVAKLAQRKGNDNKIQMLQDTIDCLTVCAENFSATTMNEFRAELRELFENDGDEDGKKKKYRPDEVVTLCTVHRAKGLEADHTFILKPEKMPLVWNEQSPVEFDQELNIKYVALTRALVSLTILGAPDCMGKPLAFDPNAAARVQSSDSPAGENDDDDWFAEDDHDDHRMMQQQAEAEIAGMMDGDDDMDDEEDDVPYPAHSDAEVWQSPYDPETGVEDFARRVYPPMLDDVDLWERHADTLPAPEEPQGHGVPISIRKMSDAPLTEPLKQGDKVVIALTDIPATVTADQFQDNSVALVTDEGAHTVRPMADVTPVAAEPKPLVVVPVVVGAQHAMPLQSDPKQRLLELVDKMTDAEGDLLVEIIRAAQAKRKAAAR